MSPDDEPQDVVWDELQGAATCSGSETPYEIIKLADDTRRDLETKGWALWKCSVLNNETIAIVKDRAILNRQIRFTDELRIATRYPVYTEAELTELISKNNPAGIRLVHEAAQKYFQGSAQVLKQMEMTETSLRDNAKVVITEHGISPTLLLGSLPVSVAPPEERKSQ